MLAIDGGGSRGVVPLEVLGELEKLSGVRTRDQFDLFCGTSTGSIIAAGLSIADLPVDVCSRLYQDLSSLLFGSRLSAAQASPECHAMLRDDKLCRATSCPAVPFGTNPFIIEPDPLSVRSGYARPCRLCSERGCSTHRAMTPMASRGLRATSTSAPSQRT